MAKPSKSDGIAHTQYSIENEPSMTVAILQTVDSLQKYNQEQ